MLPPRTVKILSAALFVTLLLWGGYVFVTYAGVDQHYGHLLPDESAAAIMASCPGGGLLCQGVQAFLPSLLYTFERASAFLPYVILSLLLLGLWLGSRAVIGERSSHPKLPVWALVPIFLGAVWLLFTTLSSVDIGQGLPLNRVIDPSTPAYAQQLTSDTLQVLRTSFASLQARGCLTPGADGSPFAVMKMSCMQQSFFTLVLPSFFFVLLVFIDFVLLGLALLPLLRLRPHGLKTWQEFLLALGLGSGAFTIILWFLAVFGLITAASGWVLLIGVPVVCWRQALRLYAELRSATLTLPANWGGLPLILGWILISLFALNFLSVIRPFPIGWDDLGSYLNRPHLLVEYGSFIPKMPSFQWEYITALGFMIFGAGSPFAAGVAMLLNWLAGVLAIAAIIGASHLLLKRGGLLTGVFYALLPMVGHFSFADMKIDNAVFFMAVLAFIGIFTPLFAEDESEGARADHWRWYLLAGIFIGLAFGFKVTSAMSLFALLLVIAGVQMGSLAAVGAGFLMITAFILQGTFNASVFATRFLGMPVTLPQGVLAVVALAAAVGCFILAATLRPRTWKPALREIGLFLLGAVVVVVPWVVHNNIYNQQWPPRLLFTAEDRLSAVLSLQPGMTSTTRTVRSLPADLAVDRSNPACTNTGTAEELDRYWGHDVGPGHYLLLPWRTVMNLDNGGYYVTTSPLLLLLPLVLLVPLFWTPAGRRWRWLAIFTAVQILQWSVLANGVLWYGLGMFIGICIFVEMLFQEAPDRPTRGLWGALIVLSLIGSLGFRFWQFELQGGSLEYTIGKMSADVIVAQTIPHYTDISQSVVARSQALPDRPYTFRMGTFIPYFIPRNPERLPVADNQLDFFSCLAQDNDPVKITARLKALGFNGIIFDLNTATIEQDPNGSLHQKVQRFINYATSTGATLQAPIIDQRTGIAYFLIP